MDQQSGPTPLRTMHDVWGLITGPEASHWSSLLVRDHLDSVGRLALFQSCLAGRDMVLSTAEHTSIQVLVMTEPGVTTTLPPVRSALVTRGNLPTALQLRADNSWHLFSALGALSEGEGTTWLDGLSLYITLDETLTSSDMATVGRCCPNLRALTVNARVQQLPSPELFPKLKELSLDSWRQHSSEDLFRSLQPYASQKLTHLALPLHGATDTKLRLLFSSPSAHLRSLKLTRAVLDDTLLGLILQCAPALEQLTVNKIHLQSDAHVHAQHQLQRLQYTDVSLSSLARLPLTPGMEVVCIGSCPLLRCDVSSMEEAVAARLKDVKFRWTNRFETHLFLTADVPDTHDEPAALRVALQTMRNWDIDNHSPRLRLTDWSMSAALQLELPGLPQWTEVRFDESIRWLPGPHLYGTLLRLLPDSYCNVRISCSSVVEEGEVGPSFRQLKSICVGAPVNRTPEAPLRITLQGCSDEWVEAVRIKMQLCPFPNVIVQQDY